MRVPLSRARSDLFRLAELVREAEDDTVVVLEARGGRESIAMVREARLTYLEDQVAQMQTQTSRPFTLAGSLTAAVDDDTLLTTLRELRQTWSTPVQPEATPAAAQPAARRKRHTRHDPGRH